jgi:hypothetical protein
VIIMAKSIIPAALIIATLAGCASAPQTKPDPAPVAPVAPIEAPVSTEPRETAYDVWKSQFELKKAQLEKERIEFYSWKTGCKYDQFQNYTTCTAQTHGADDNGVKTVWFGDEKFNRTIRVVWVTGMPKRSRLVCINGQTFPGKRATFRVDSGAVVTGTDEQCFRASSSFIGHMRAGNSLYIVYNTFPYENSRTVVDLAGFTAADNELTRKISEAK